MAQKNVTIIIIVLAIILVLSNSQQIFSIVPNIPTNIKLFYMPDKPISGSCTGIPCEFFADTQGYITPTTSFPLTGLSEPTISLDYKYNTNSITPGKASIFVYATMDDGTVITLFDDIVTGAVTKHLEKTLPRNERIGDSNMRIKINARIRASNDANIITYIGVSSVKQSTTTSVPSSSAQSTTTSTQGQISQSICGNGILETGEVCEKKIGSNVGEVLSSGQLNYACADDAGNDCINCQQLICDVCSTSKASSYQFCVAQTTIPSGQTQQTQPLTFIERIILFIKSLFGVS